MGTTAPDSTFGNNTKASPLHSVLMEKFPMNTQRFNIGIIN
jgi:hypothetical protein